MNEVLKQIREEAVARGEKVVHESERSVTVQASRRVRYCHSLREDGSVGVTSIVTGRRAPRRAARKTDGLDDLRALLRFS